jgi:hypothetical protein
MRTECGRRRNSGTAGAFCVDTSEGAVAMRAAVPLIAACAALAACASQPAANTTPPPTVSYRIPDHNVAATDAEAQNYCAVYSRAAQYRGVQATSAGAVAVYSCVEAPADSAGTTVPPAPPAPLR